MSGYCALAAPGIYIASKAKHGPRWQALRDSGVPIYATWIDECGAGQTADYGEFWSRIVRDVTACCALVAYHESGETMKGALVEIGIALAAGIPVFWTGADPAYTVVHHPLVTRCETLEQAMERAALARAGVSP